MEVDDFVIQNRLDFNSLTNKFSNKKDSLFQTLVERAKIFEEFSKQLSLELQTLYQEYLIQQIEHELQFTINKLEKSCNCNEQIEVQKKLIETLKDRIKRLETNSTVKNQEIEKLEQNIQVLEKDINHFLENQQLKTKEITKRKSVSFDKENLDEKNNHEGSKSIQNLLEATDSELAKISTNELKPIKRDIKYEEKSSSKQNDQITTPVTPTYTISIHDVIKKYMIKLESQLQPNQQNKKDDVESSSNNIENNNQDNFNRNVNGWRSENQESLVNNDFNWNVGNVNYEGWRQDGQKVASYSTSLIDDDFNGNVDHEENWRLEGQENVSSCTSLSDNYSSNKNVFPLNNEDNWRSESQEDSTNEDNWKSESQEDSNFLGDNDSNEDVFLFNDEQEVAPISTPLNNNWGSEDQEDVSFNTSLNNNHSNMNVNNEYGWRSDDQEDASFSTSLNNHSNRNVNNEYDWGSEDQEDASFSTSLNNNHSNRNINNEYDWKSEDQEDALFSASLDNSHSNTNANNEYDWRSEDQEDTSFGTSLSNNNSNRNANNEGYWTSEDQVGASFNTSINNNHSNRNVNDGNWRSEGQENNNNYSNDNGSLFNDEGGWKSEGQEDTNSFSTPLSDNSSLRPSNNSYSQIDSLYQESQAVLKKIDSQLDSQIQQAYLKQISSQLHSQVQQIVSRRENCSTKAKSKHFKPLRKCFTISDFIQYTKTNYFISLDDDSKKGLNQLIDTSLLEEFDQQNVTLSQNLEEYTKRGIIPELPSGYKNYTKYEKSSMFDKLSKVSKERVKKLIVSEKKSNS